MDKVKYVTFLYRIWCENGEFFWTRNVDKFYEKMNEYEYRGIDYYFDTERELHY